jgi:hypothetical protein
VCSLCRMGLEPCIVHDVIFNCLFHSYVMYQFVCVVMLVEMFIFFSFFLVRCQHFFVLFCFHMGVLGDFSQVACGMVVVA